MMRHAPTSRLACAFTMPDRLFLSRMGLMGLLLFLTACNSGSLTPGTFDVLPSQVNGGNGRAFHTAVVDPATGDVVVIGGQGPDGTALANTSYAERLARAEVSFVPEIRLDPTLGRVNPVAVAAGTDILVLTGQASSGIDTTGVAAFNTPEALSATSPPVSGGERLPLSTNFVPISDPIGFPGGITGAAVIRTSGGRTFQLGGRDGVGPLTAIFEVTGNLLVPVIDMAVAREGHTVSELADGTLLIVGGWGTSALPLLSAEIFDPVQGTSQLLTAAEGPLIARAAHTATASSDGCQVLIYGGLAATGTSLTTQAEVFELGANAGCPGAVNRFRVVFHDISLPVSRIYHTATLLANGDVLLVGGIVSDAGAISGTAQLYHFDVNQLVAAPGSLTFPRFGHTATRLQDSTVVIIGGLGGSPASPNMAVASERYLPLVL